MVSDQDGEELSIVMVIGKEEVERGRRMEKKERGRRKEKNDETRQLIVKSSIGANVP